MINDALIAELETIEDPGKLLAELERRFPKRTAIGTSGQLTGCALIDLAYKAKIKPRVFTVDTLRLFRETYELFERLEDRYPGLRIERYTPAPKDLDPMIKQFGEYLFFDSKEKQEMCCNVRKVLPNQRALDTVDVWITGLRSDQSRSRAAVSRFQIIQHSAPEGLRPILKVAPLAGWTEQRVREYLKQNRVPSHELLDQKLAGGYYYESLGCIICTTPIGPNEPRRAGRWRWFNSDSDPKECGIHLPPPSDK